MVRRVNSILRWIGIALLVLTNVSPASANEPSAATEASDAADFDPFGELSWRPIGPVNMSGRVTDVEGIPGDPRIVYVAAASGGIWKTTDGGLTFKPLFDDQPLQSIGDLALAPSNREVIYAGTGEANPRNSVSIGAGVYRSTDGGDSWTFLGLEETRHIPRIVVHPHDPDTAWVGALGHIFGPNEERGVYKTTDGGKSWRKVFYLDDQHGVADMDLDPNNPNILYVAMWKFDRKPWTHTSGSEDGGIWKSVDGGESWSQLEDGLPKLLGRIGVRVAPSNSNVVYVIAESDEGTLFRSDDRGKSFTKMTEDVQIVSRGLYYTKLMVDPVDENRVYAISSRLFVSLDGGRNFERISRTTHVDYHALWADPLDADRVWQGQDGGVAVSYDRGTTWEPIRNLPIGQFYQVFYDQRQPFYHLGGGLQDNGTWVGPSRTREPAGILQDDWRMMSFGDAYFVVPHPEQTDLYLSEYQGGGILRTDMTTRKQVDVSPQPRRNDGGPVGELTYRFNWNAPIVISPHDAQTVYFAGNAVFKTTDFGDSWQRISPDLTTDDPDKQGEAGGPVWKENTTAEYHCTIISFAESPVAAGMLWAGTDDGNLQLSTDGGANWTDLTASLEVPAFSPVSHVEPSRTDAGTAYVSFDRHMFDDYRPHLYRTSDSGASWQRLSDGLPEVGWIWVVREDPNNPDLLWVGTEMGLYASYDRGASWREMPLENLPSVSIHDIQIHPRENDLILGTHGRGIWVFDDATPLQTEPTSALGDASAHLYPVRSAMRFPTRFTRYGLGDKRHKAPNPPNGAIITYALAEDLEPSLETASPESAPSESAADEQPEGQAADDAATIDPANEAAEPRIRLEILDPDGELLREIEKLGTERGLHRAHWDLSTEPPRPRKKSDEEESSEFGFSPRGPRALPGSYRVRLTVDGATYEQTVEVRMDPSIEVSRGDLQAAYNAASELRDLQSSIHDGLRALDGLRHQLTARRELSELLEQELSDVLDSAWTVFDERLDELLGQLARTEDKPFWSQGPKLSERLSDLSGSIDDQFQAPTAAQIALLGELRVEVEERIEELNEFFWTEVNELNQLLEADGIAPLSPPAAIGAESVA